MLQKVKKGKGMEIKKSKYNINDIELLWREAKGPRRRIVIETISAGMGLLFGIPIFLVTFAVVAYLLNFVFKIELSSQGGMDILFCIVLFLIAAIILFILPLWSAFTIIIKFRSIILKQLYKTYGISDYYYLVHLYENMNEFFSYLEIDEHPDITLQGDDYVKITIHKQNIMEEHRLRFPGIISKLFQPDKMDFSYLDELVEAVLQNNKEG